MGWYSVIGYFCRLVLLGSKGSTWGLSVRQYCQERKKQNSDQMFNIFAWYLSYEKIQFATCKAAQDFFFSMTVSAANAKQEVQPH